MCRQYDYYGEDLCMYVRVLAMKTLTAGINETVQRVKCMLENETKKKRNEQNNIHPVVGGLRSQVSGLSTTIELPLYFYTQFASMNILFINILFVHTLHTFTQKYAPLMVHGSFFQWFRLSRAHVLPMCIASH